MQFSLRWLLAGVGIAAIACTSIVYAGDLWDESLAGIGFAASAASTVILLVAKRSTAKAFATGFLLCWCAGTVILHGKHDATEKLRGGVNRIAYAIVDFLPHQEAAIRRYVRNEHDAEISSEDFVQNMGIANGVASIQIGSPFGGLDANGQIRQPAQFNVPTTVYQRIPTKRDVQLVVRQHLVLIFALVGGVFGAWIYRRQVKADAALAANQKA